MSIQLDPRVTELICARLCHDLIGPIAAINNGVEFVREFSDELEGDAFDLIGESAAQASSLLQFYRIALGSGRSADGSSIGICEARERTLAALNTKRISIIWPKEHLASNIDLGRSGVKLLLNLILLGVELLPGAGIVRVSMTETRPNHITVQAEKEGFSLNEEFLRVLNSATSIEELTPRTVQAYLTLQLADNNDIELFKEIYENSIVFSIFLK